MDKIRVIVKEESGCRILVNPRPEQYAHLRHVINPDLSRVRGLSPHEWDIVGDRVVSINPPCLPPEETYISMEQKVARIESKLEAVPGLIRMHKAPKPPKVSLWPIYAVVALTCAANAALAVILFR